MTRLYEDDAELYDIAFDWDISDEADWLATATGGLLWHELGLVSYDLV